jgi:hypothetical protein
MNARTTLLFAPALLAAGAIAQPADHAHHMPPAADVNAAMRAAAAFQDLEAAEEAGYVNTMDGLGCFQSAEHGGMGLHYLRESLLDATLDPAAPEALVYELDSDGDVVGLVAHEYIVPVAAWESESPPTVMGMELHRHAVLPLWVLHTWLWKHNPAGFFADYNPAVRMCPEGVKIFGQD